MKLVTIEQWAVIRAQGAGHIEAIAHNRDNAILAYTWRHVSKERGFDFLAWWKANANKAKLVCQKISITTKHIPGSPYSGWDREYPSTRCEWDMGHETICIQQCTSEGRHEVDGHRLCGAHLNAFKRRGVLVLATKEVGR